MINLLSTHRKLSLCVERLFYESTILNPVEERLKYLKEKFFSDEPMSQMEFDEMNELAFLLTPHEEQ